MRITDFAGNPNIGHATLTGPEQLAFGGVERNLFQEIPNLDHVEFFDLLNVVGAELGGELPEMYDQLQRLASHRTGYKVVVVDGPVLDPEALPPTPDRYLDPHENPILPAAVSRALILGMMGVYPYGYTSQQPGNVINNVIAIKSYEGLRGTSANAAEELGLHTEDASYNLIGACLPNGQVLDGRFNLSPDWLTLQFLRNPDSIPTFVSIPDLNRLTHEGRQALEQPWFINRTNPSQGGHDNDADLPLSVIYEGEDGNVRLRANTSALEVIEGAPEAAQTAQKELLSLLEQCSVDLNSEPGDTFLIDNHQVLHGRRAYDAKQPKWNGQDRWQQRVVASDSPLIQKFEVSPRIVNPDNFLKAVGNIAAEAKAI